MEKLRIVMLGHKRIPRAQSGYGEAQSGSGFPACREMGDVKLDDMKAKVDVLYSETILSSGNMRKIKRLL